MTTHLSPAGSGVTVSSVSSERAVGRRGRKAESDSLRTLIVCIKGLRLVHYRPADSTLQRTIIG